MKRIKMVLYGEPGVGKSTFAVKAPKPFFICTDGNYEWLEDFGADPNAAKQISSWDEAKKCFAADYDGYETIVVDLLEDLFKWCEYEYCKRNKFEHVADVGYGKGYDITRNEFFNEISKLLSRDKNIILIMHGFTTVVKDRRGVEHNKYVPSNRIPDKVIDMIEGRVRYFLRCYISGEEQADGTVIKRRYLSLIPKENEFGICRGIDEAKVAHDIPLEWDDFAKAIGYEDVSTKQKSVRESKVIRDTSEAESHSEKFDNDDVNNVEETKEVKDAEEEKPVETTRRRRRNVAHSDEIKEEKDRNVAHSDEIKEEKDRNEVSNNVEAKEEKDRNEISNNVEAKKEMSNEDKIAAIKAKLAAIKNKN